MKVVELDSEDVESLVLAPTSARTPGPAHVSNIIRDIENRVLKPGQRRPYDTLGKDEQRRMGNYMSVGWAWEEVIRAALVSAQVLDAGKYVGVGELVLDDIYGTPDWLDAHDWCIEEFKATWRSSRRPLDPDFWHWLAQIKAYCKMMATDWARLRVFYVNGNYRDSGPQIKNYRLEFTKMEIMDNWSMLTNHAKGRGWIK